MDSLSQLALGAAVGVAVMGRRTAVWKAALWGGVCGTLPDLDALIGRGDPISDMTYHRTESHALFYQTLLAPVLAWLIARLQGEREHWRRWWLMVWLALVTHPLLDLMTVYGTQLGLPFTDHPYAVGSVFIIDPLYTLPLLVGLAAALMRPQGRGRAWNTAGLVLSTAYLAWGAAAQQHVTSIARASLPADEQASARLLVTPTPFNTVLWRVVAVTPDGWREGYHSLLDAEPRVHFEPYPRGNELYAPVRDNWHVARLAWFSKGFFKLTEQGGELRISDLRMGMEPYYTFTFTVAERRGGAWVAVPPRLIQQRPDLKRGLAWLWRRALGDPAPLAR
ncbi:metal-dependent hydrolase [Caldimonas brevitalea]|uniref:Hydrolase n=1 Tax=Caldimonas brevitalea TaxID=413882 RepID=A0A0G3BPR1_9BURK|nr:metal-dependent hydrolase [Caldimonas brevitalea]AKJ31419.1 hydrolase [Caldimonas brevitalea]